MKVSRSLSDLDHSFPRPVATIGNFDGMHLGHQRLMRDLVVRARQISGTPTVITFDPHPLQVLAPNNAPRQIQTIEQKLAVMDLLGVKLAIVIPFTRDFAQMEARDFAVEILACRIRIQEVYVGPSFAFGHRREGSFKLLKEIGEEHHFTVGKIPQIEFRGNRVSSTAVRQLLLAGQVALARRLLARPFALEGKVVHGASAGAGIGFPTANLLTRNDLIPRNGVYVTRLLIEGVLHPSVTNIGVRPTVSTGLAPLTIETHVLDFCGDLYDRSVGLEFLNRLREERKFPGKDALFVQIQKDVDRARGYFRWVTRLAPSLIA